MSQGLLTAERGGASFAYHHDPCELGRGLGIYEEPRAVLGTIGRLEEVADNRDEALCCGGSRPSGARFSATQHDSFGCVREVRSDWGGFSGDIVSHVQEESLAVG